MSKKLKAPEEHIEYWFWFPASETRSHEQEVNKFEYCLTNDKGRLCFLVNGTYTTDMPPKRFDYLFHKRKVKTVKLKGYVEPVFTPINKAESADEFELRIINMLKNLSPAQFQSVEAKIGYSPLKLAKDLEGLRDASKTYTREFENRVGRDMCRALDICMPSNNDKNNLKFNNV